MVLGLFFSISICAIAREPADSKWFACANDNDCSAVKSDCPKVLKSVNKKFLKLYSRWASKTKTKCETGSNFDSIPFCDHGLCWLGPGKHRSGK